jgi:anti-anti-sigma factor
MLATAVLDIEHSPDSSNVHRLGVSGELDAETAPRLISGLRGTRGAAATHVHLDLSGVTFIDCSGLTALLSALDEARSAGWVMEVDERVSAPVRRIIQLTRTRGQIWP